VGAEHHYNLFAAARADEGGGLDILSSFHAGEFVNRIRPGSLVMLPEEHRAALERARAAAAAATAAAAAAAEEGAGGGAAAAGGGAAAAAGEMDDEAGGQAAKKARGGAAAAAPATQGKAAAAPSSASASASASPAAPGVSDLPMPRFIFGTVSGAIGVLIDLPPALHAFLARAQAGVARVVAPVGGLSHRSFREPFSYDSQGAASAAAGAGGAGGGSRGFVDGDLLELFLDLEPAAQQAVVAFMNRRGGAAAATTVEEVLKAVEDMSRLH